MKLSNEVKIALTAIVAIALLFVGINFLKGINVFESSNSYYVKFKDIQGLAVSNAVYANGYPVGIVRAIDYNYSTNSSVVVRIELDEGMRVPRGTTAELETALMGGVTMSLMLGPNPSDNLAPHDTIVGGPKIGAMDRATAMLPDVQRMLPKVDSLLMGLNRLVGDPALRQSLRNAATISENLKTTTAQLDKLMAQEVPQMVGHLNRTSANAEKITAELAQANMGETVDKAKATLASVHQLSTQLHDIMIEVQGKMTSRDNNLGAFLGDRQLYDRVNRTVQSADSLMNDLKANPKRYVHFSIFGRK